jgi:hypothetical protein
LATPAGKGSDFDADESRSVYLLSLIASEPVVVALGGGGGKRSKFDLELPEGPDEKDPALSQSRCGISVASFNKPAACSTFNVVVFRGVCGWLCSV